jgi:transcriptional regulator with XRE-family HTH domain
MLKDRANVIGSRPEKRNHEFSADARVSSEIMAFLVNQHGFTQRQVAGILKVHYSYVSKVLKGQRNLTLTHIEAISKALDMPMPVFLWHALKPKTSSTRNRKACDEIDELFREVYPEVFEHTGLDNAAIRARSHGRKRPLVALAN